MERPPDFRCIYIIWNQRGKLEFKMGLTSAKSPLHTFVADLLKGREIGVDIHIFPDNAKGQSHLLTPKTSETMNPRGLAMPIVHDPLQQMSHCCSTHGCSMSPPSLVPLKGPAQRITRMGRSSRWEENFIIQNNSDTHRHAVAKGSSFPPAMPRRKRFILVAEDVPAQGFFPAVA